MLTPPPTHGRLILPATAMVCKRMRQSRRASLKLLRRLNLKFHYRRVSNDERSQSCRVGKETNQVKKRASGTLARKFLLLFWRHFAFSHPHPVNLGCVYAFFLYARTNPGIAKHCAFKQ